MLPHVSMSFFVGGSGYPLNESTTAVTPLDYFTLYAKRFNRLHAIQVRFHATQVGDGMLKAETVVPEIV